MTGHLNTEPFHVSKVIATLDFVARAPSAEHLGL